jgi:hypothetical protein
LKSVTAPAITLSSSHKKAQKAQKLFLCFCASLWLKIKNLLTGPRLLLYKKRFRPEEVNPMMMSWTHIEPTAKRQPSAYIGTTTDCGVGLSLNRF